MSEVTNTDGGAHPAGKGGSKRLVVIGGAAAALLAVVGAGGWFLIQSGMLSDAPEAQVATVPEPYFLDLPELVVNLNTGTGDTGYLRVTIALELREESVAGLVTPRMPRVLDAFQVYLRELRRSDLEGSAGIHRLKEELLRRVNLAVYPASVENILFKEILIQ